MAKRKKTQKQIERQNTKRALKAERQRQHELRKESRRARRYIVKGPDTGRKPPQKGKRKPWPVGGHRRNRAVG